jgi:phosphoribosylamine--glycine ligase
VNWADDHALTVVLAAGGYPGRPETVTAIGGLDGLPADSMRMMFHAGTRAEGGQVLAAGGRLLNATARGATLAEARARACALVEAVEWPGGFCRRDIGWRALG